MPQASVNDVQLYYEERGSGTPILGIHGAGSSALVWEEAAKQLSGLGRATTYDRRGCTRSERPDPYEVTTVEEHTDDALELLRKLDARPAIVIGRSYGGTVALDLAIRYPESVLCWRSSRPARSGFPPSTTAGSPTCGGGSRTPPHSRGSMR